MTTLTIILAVILLIPPLAFIVNEIYDTFKTTS
jgi:hypothetical protein